MPGARRIAEVTPEHLAALEAGTAETRTLAEALAIDLGRLARQALPGLGEAALARLSAKAGEGITRRMALAGTLCLEAFGPAGLPRLAAHPSDTVRGIACFALGAAADLPPEDALAAVRPLADDAHFGVREWAWLALRPRIAAALPEAVALLARWTEEPSANLRRFASEATRPRGVWCAHIAALKREPALGLPILAPLRRDPARYVQDSVGNWLNDAAKDNPAWVRGVIGQWTAEPEPVAPRIATAALRSVK